MDIAYEIGTLSKVLAPALRIGYLLGPDGPLMNAMVQRTSDAGFSAPLFVQEMAGYLLDARIEDQLRAVNAGYRGKGRRRARTESNATWGRFSPDAAAAAAGFYYYLTFRAVETHPASRFLQAPDPHHRRPRHRRSGGPAAATRALHSRRVLRPPARRTGRGRPAPATALLRLRRHATNPLRARPDADRRAGRYCPLEPALTITGSRMCDGCSRDRYTLWVAAT